MKMHSWSANKLRDIDDFVNENHIKKEDIVSIFPRQDGTYTITYFAEE